MDFPNALPVNGREWRHWRPAIGKAVVGSEVLQEGIADDVLGLDEEETLNEAT